MHAHLSGTVCKHLMPVFEFDFEHRVRQWLYHCSFKNDRVFLWLSQLSLLIEILVFTPMNGQVLARTD